MHTRIPIWKKSACFVWQAPDYEELAELDRTKAKMKEYADSVRRANRSTVQEGDWVLVRQEQKRKSDSQYHEHPLKVTKQKGAMITAASDDNRITLNITQFRKCNPLPKGSVSGVKGDVTKNTPVPVKRPDPTLCSTMGELTDPTSASQPQRA
ncbi:hypothetical protein NDU88_001867 [Pleurodeles waltl]|uniref:Uncharacterized protein n=1 Tax=Pleurodeles waltl TaxID=8319 RepID=A0AAV7P7W3_PLEWA|nr:hypothetical protein NDU88_001867 [Pleurodeles waltl]